MRLAWMLFLGLAATMVFVLPRLSRRAPTTEQPAAQGPGRVGAVLTTSKQARALLSATPPAASARADNVVAFGLAQQGTPYHYAGISPLTGFDCSGFILYTFAHVGVAVPHSTALLIDVGQPVARTDAQPGDIVVFTGTAATSTTPGHAGIVISGRGEVPLRFVHSSSARRESGVKVSQVEGTDYERRFMQVRRVLGSAAMATARPVPAARPPRVAVAPLPQRPVAAVPLPTPDAALPQALPVRKPAARKTTVSKRVQAKSQASAHKRAVAKPKPMAPKQTAKHDNSSRAKSRARKAPLKARRISARKPHAG